jgi:hypothetical protein
VRPERSYLRNRDADRQRPSCVDCAEPGAGCWQPVTNQSHVYTRVYSPFPSGLVLLLWQAEVCEGANRVHARLGSQMWSQSNSWSSPRAYRLAWISSMRSDISGLFDSTHSNAATKLYLSPPPLPSAAASARRLARCAGQIQRFDLSEYERALNAFSSALGITCCLQDPTAL